MMYSRKRLNIFFIRLRYTPARHPQKMPPRTGLAIFVGLANYKYAAPTVLGMVVASPPVLADGHRAERPRRRRRGTIPSPPIINQYVKEQPPVYQKIENS